MTDKNPRRETFMKKSMSLLLTGALLLSACSSPETSQTEASTAEQTTQAANTAAATEQIGRAHV